MFGVLWCFRLRWWRQNDVISSLQAMSKTTIRSHPLCSTKPQGRLLEFHSSLIQGFVFESEYSEEELRQRYVWLLQLHALLLEWLYMITCSLLVASCLHITIWLYHPVCIGIDVNIWPLHGALTCKRRTRRPRHTRRYGSYCTERQMGIIPWRVVHHQHGSIIYHNILALRCWMCISSFSPTVLEAK